MGWHEFQLEHYAEAREWMKRSLELNGTDNRWRHTYLTLSEKLIAEGKATNALPRR